MDHEKRIEGRLRFKRNIGKIKSIDETNPLIFPETSELTEIIIKSVRGDEYFNVYADVSINVLGERVIYEETYKGTTLNQKIYVGEKKCIDTTVEVQL